MDEELTILRMARDKTLPNSLGETSGIDMDRVAELFEAGLLKGINASTYEAREFLELRITHFGRQRLEQLEIGERSSKVESTRHRQNGPRVFISHSSADRTVAAALAELLRTTLNLPSDQIRCTSVDGYKLPPGATSDEQLRHEVLESDVFVALLSRANMASVYVMFELGARWASPKKLLPVLIRQLSSSVLRKPLDGINAVSGNNESDVEDLLVDVAAQLGLQVEKPAIYRDALNKFRTAASEAEEPKATLEQAGQSQEATKLLRDEVSALWVMGHHFENGHLRGTARDISNFSGMGRLAAQVALDGLDAKGLVWAAHGAEGSSYQLSNPSGRKVAVRFMESPDPSSAWAYYMSTSFEPS